MLLFVKNFIKFFAEGGDNQIALILLNLILILAIFHGILNKEKMISNKKVIQANKLDKFVKINKNNDKR